MENNTLKRQHPNKVARQVGRGGTRGKQSGRGGKGQTARSGNKRRPEMRDIIKKLPKLRGYRFKSPSDKASVVNVGQLNVFKAKSIVNPESLLAMGLVRRLGGATPKVKILGTGEISVVVSVVGCIISTVATDKIKAAGGEVK